MLSQVLHPPLLPSTEAKGSGVEDAPNGAPAGQFVSVVWGIIGLSLTAGAASQVQVAPTGLSWWDPLLTAAAAAGLTALLSLGPRLVVFGGLAMAVVLGSGGQSSTAALLGLLAALLAEVLRLRWWPFDLVPAALLSLGLLHLRPIGGFGTNAGLAGCFGLCALVATSYRLGTVGRRRLRRMVVGIFIVLLLALAGGGLAAIRAESHLAEGSDLARLGLDAARDGDVERAEELLDGASDSLGAAERQLDAWYVRPARLLPIVSQHLHVGRTAASTASSVAASAQLALVEADIDRLRVSNGAVDLDLVASMAGPLAATVESLEAAVSELEASRSPWLLAPVDSQIDDAIDELVSALPEAEKAADATRLLPGMLGAEGPRRYLVLFATPAEARELGGIVGNVVELTVDDGKVTITDQKRDGDLNAVGPGMLENPETYPARYLVNQPEVFSQNWSGMTDLPSVARAVADLYPSMGGRPIDGVFYADPYGIAALMEFTGPVEVPELGRTIDSESVVPFLLVEQYQEFENPDRISFLDRIAVVTFERLLRAELPSPRRVGDVLGPAARQGRLQMATFDDDENDFLETMFLLGDLPDPDGEDHLAVVHANGGADKLDGFLTRTIRYTAEVDPVSGDLEATVAIELSNDVPPGLPDYVIGHPDREVPPGTNRVHLSIYTPHQLRGVTVDGSAVEPELQRELGFQRYLIFAEVAPGETVTVIYQLTGSVELSERLYRLTVAPQAVANVDRWVIEVRVGDAVLASDGLVVEDTIFQVPVS